MKRGWSPFLVLLSVAACTSTGKQARRPDFAEPRSGVFQAPMPIVESTHDDMMPTVDRGSGQLVYASKINGNIDIYARPINGGSARRLTLHSADDTDPRFSPDGERIAWRSQRSDVKGDIWVMNRDGDDKEKLTGRGTADGAPVWSPSGQSVYFTSRELGASDRIERYDLEYRERSVVVEDGWDPAVNSDGSVLFFAALDDRHQTRIFARRLSDGKTVPVTDGAYPEGMPTTGSADGRVSFVRFVDDRNSDGSLDGADGASIWTTSFAPELFDGGEPPRPTPLTGGSGSELFVSMVGDWFVYTTWGFGDLEIYGLPEDGTIAPGVEAQTIFEAARAEDDVTLRRLALRHLIANAPELEANARYELARDLAEANAWAAARAEFRRAAEAFGNNAMAGVCELEITRLRVLELLGGEFWARERSQVERTRSALEEIERHRDHYADSLSVVARNQVTKAELFLALGRLMEGATLLEAVAYGEDYPAEDSARALSRLAEAYQRLGDDRTLARVCERLLSRFSAERYDARRCAERWVRSAASPTGAPKLDEQRGVNALGVSVLSQLEGLVRTHSDLPLLAARASAALANEQSEQGHDRAARDAWQTIVDNYGDEKEVLSKALLTLGQGAEARGERDLALESYERIIARFPENPALRARARKGITRIALAKAAAEERAGDYEGAIDSYRRLLKNDRDLATAHRRYITLAARLGRREQVVAEYEDAVATMPSDKYAHYGYGFALTHRPNFDLDDAEESIDTALELDPRMAPAHLTLGWLRLQRERRDPRRGWAEKALNSFSSAQDLLDRSTEPRLWAAARLNSANAFFELNKFDDAFLAYLDRALDPTPFDQPLTRLIFHERFARAALREGYLDVALDQALQGYQLAATLPGKPRSAANGALIGGVYYLAGMNDLAIEWLTRATDDYVAREDWNRAVPLLRTQALAFQRADRFSEALASLRRVARLTSEEKGPTDPDKPLFGPLELQLWVELGAKADNITRGAYGFDREEEREIVAGQLARVSERFSKRAEAEDYHRERIKLMRQLYNEKNGSRIAPEWVAALHEAARTLATNGKMEEARSLWFEGLEIARLLGAHSAVVAMSESILRIVLRAEKALPAAQRQALEKGLKAVVERGEPNEKSAAARILGLTHYLTFFEAMAQTRTVDGAKEPKSDSLFTRRFDALTAAATSLSEAAQLARTFEHEDLGRAIAAVGGEPPQTEAQADDGVVGSDSSNPSSSSEPELDGQGEKESTAQPTTGVTKETKRELSPNAEPLLRARLTRHRVRWRELYDEWLSSRDEKKLDETIAAFISEPRAVDVPEYARFVKDVTKHFDSDDRVEQAWRFFEHLRLQELQPSVMRQRRLPASDSWRRIVSLRHSKDYEEILSKSPAVIRALEGRPVSSDTLRKILGPKDVLLQVFAQEDTLYWFAIDNERLDRFRVEGSVDEIPRSVGAWLAAKSYPEGEGPKPVVYLDLGDTAGASGRAMEIADGGGPLLNEKREVSEVLSATYLVASYEERTFARTEPAIIGDGGLPARYANPEELSNVGDERSVVHLSIPGRLSLPGLRVGESQVVFQGPEGQVLDLDELARVELDTQVLLVDEIHGGRAAVRALAQSALLAGAPATIVSPSPADALRYKLASGLADARLISVLGTDARDAYVFGHRGMDLGERVVNAYERLLTFAREAVPAYKRAQSSGLASDWRSANKSFSELLNAIEYLLVPEHREALANSGVRGGAPLAKSLPARALQLQNQYAQTFLALGEIQDAAAVQRLIVDAYDRDGEEQKALEQLLELGKTLMAGQEYEEARDTLNRCAEIAAKRQKTLTEADCRSRLGSVFRSLFAYDRAREQYETSIALYSREQHPNKIYPMRYLGFLYESSLNDYESALLQFSSALESAAATEAMKKLVPVLNLDVARVHRQRGDYALALQFAAKAAQATPETDSKTLADVLLERAKILWYQGDYRRALAGQERALEIARLIGNTFQEIQALSLRGLVTLNQGELELAEKFIRQALELARLTKRRSEEAIQLNNLGVVLQRAGRLEEAVATFQLALSIDDELGTLEGRAFDLRSLGVALGRKGEEGKALDVLREALRLSRQIGARYNELQTLFAEGEILDRQERNDEARTRYEAAARLAAETSVAEVQWRSLYALGRLANLRNDSAEARRYFDEALAVAEGLGRSRDSVGSGMSRDDLYADAIRLAINQGDSERAFHLLERLRARSRLDVLTSREIPLANPAVRNELRTVGRLRERWLRSERKGEKASAEEAQRKWRDALSKFQKNFPRFAQTFLVAPLQLSEIQRRIPRGTVLLSYFVGKRRSFVFVVDSARLQVVPLELNHESLARLVSSIREKLRAYAPLDAELEVAGGLLLTPVDEALGGAEHVVVIPHGPLTALPFAALSSNGAPMIDRVSLSEASSASLLALVLDGAPTPRTGEVTAFAHGHDLPFARLEALAVGTQSFIDDEATTARFFASTSPAVDVAAHAELDPEDPLTSAIQLASLDGDDGRLEVREIFAAAKSPALLTLSGCQTALDSPDGTARMSLAEAFLTTGAQSVVASRERVSDLAASLVIKRFYRNRAFRSVADALRRAQLETRGRFAHPAHWATFVLIGDFR